jgi:hypothetical protein
VVFSVLSKKIYVDFHAYLSGVTHMRQEFTVWTDCFAKYDALPLTNVKVIWIITLRAAVYFTQFLLPKTKIIVLTCLSFFPKRIMLTEPSAKQAREQHHLTIALYLSLRKLRRTAMSGGSTKYRVSMK